MNVTKMMNQGVNVQIVCSLTDLKEVFNQWQDERDANQPTPKEDRLLSADEAAGMLDVSNVTLWRWAKMGYLKPVKAGRKVHYWQSAIYNLLKQKEG